MDNYIPELIQHNKLSPYWFAYDSNVIAEVSQLLENKVKNPLWSKDLEELFQ
jgi:predicted house-cleaning noncanonical NTP pyrophosphatase (MazG superfamily)